MAELIQLSEEDMRGPKPPIAPSHGCWIAGGAVRRWFTGTEKLSDVDIFGTPESIKAFCAAQTSPKIYETKNAITYLNNNVRVQAILLPMESLEQCIGQFDFALCQFAWDGEKIFSTSKAIISTLRKHLAVNNIHPEYAIDSLRRAFKYHKKGYEPCAGTLKDIALSLRGLTDEDIANAIEISPSGGRRTVRYD